MKGRSAFSVYSEDKADLKFKALSTSKQSNNKRPFKDQRSVKMDILAPKTTRNEKVRNLKQKMKKEKEKFSKLTTDNIRESLVLFNGVNKNAQNHHAKSSEFRVLGTIDRNNKKPAQNGSSSSKKQPARQEKIAEKRKPKKEEKPQKKQKFNSKLNVLREESIEQDNSRFDSEEFMFDSRKEASKLFNKMINPIKHKEFFSKFWEKKPMLVKRGDKDYYNNWFSCKEFDFIMRNHNLEFTQNVDITSYVDGVKQKHNPEGRAHAPLVWDFFQQGCSIRLLNPATYSQNIWKHLSLLQEFFGCCVGSNIYLTPKGTQGFAPHYDDIEAFVLQLEGRKRWRVYSPLNDDSTLPRYSSENFNDSDLPAPIIDVVLEQGDLLYFPRGFIHQANAVDDIHSLHITVSCYQLNSWGDFLSKLIPGALENAIAEDVEFRRGLPIGFLDHNGIVYSDNKPTNERADFRKKTVELFKKLVKYLPIDAAIDQTAKRFIHESLPPCLTENEKARSIHGHGEQWNSSKNRVENISEIEPETSIKIIRKNCLRLVMENDSILVYHNMENSKVFCEKEPVPLEIQVEHAPAIEKLIVSYPKYIKVEDLPIESLEDKIVVAQCLYDKGLLVTGEPLECDYEDVSEDGCDEEENGNSSDSEDPDDDFNSVDYDNFDNNQDEEIDDSNSDLDETERPDSSDDQESDADANGYSNNDDNDDDDDDDYGESD